MSEVNPNYAFGHSTILTLLDTRLVYLTSPYLQA